MKTPQTPQDEPTPPQARESSELTLFIPSASDQAQLPDNGFSRPPNDFAPTRPTPEVDPADPSYPPPEYRPVSPPMDEASPQAIFTQHLHQTKSEDHAPAPQPATALQPSPQTSAKPVMSTETPTQRSIPSHKPKASGSSLKLWIGLGVLLLLITGGAAYGFLRPTSETREENTSTQTSTGANAATPESVPPELRPYMDQAKAGDAKAMHMIALMYWNGLNVRQDRVKGLAWYHKAAAAGSTAAQQFLKDSGEK